MNKPSDAKTQTATTVPPLKVVKLDATKGKISREDFLKALAASDAK